MAIVSMSDLLKSGVHFGHQTRRWNPKMKPYILTERNGIYIIDLQETLNGIEKAYEFVKETVAHSGTVLFVGTKKQAQEAIEQQAQRVEMPYVNHRWLGGMLTNFNTVHKRLQRLKELEHVDFDDVAGSGRTKKELLMMRREKDKLARTLGGIRNMVKTPSAVWIVDTNKEHLAVAEARKLNIPIIAVLDTNCDPDEVDYAIAGNDDAIRAVGILTRVIADACAQGIIERSQMKKTKEQPESEPEGEEVSTEGDDPIPEWQEELLRGDDPSQTSSEEKADEPKAEEEPAEEAPSEEAEEEKVEAAVEDAPVEEAKEDAEQQKDAEEDAQ